MLSSFNQISFRRSYASRVKPFSCTVLGASERRQEEKKIVPQAERGEVVWGRRRAYPLAALAARALVAGRAGRARAAGLAALAARALRPFNHTAPVLRLPGLARHPNTTRAIRSRRTPKHDYIIHAIPSYTQTRLNGKLIYFRGIQKRY